MPTFIDESGDTGHRKHSKPYFRLAAVWMPTLRVAEDFREAVRKLRPTLPIRADYEFKFVKTHTIPAVREKFFQTALTFPFYFAACCIDKEAGHWRIASSQEQHWAAATSLAVHLRPVYHKAEQPGHPFRDQVIVDNNDDHGFLDEIQKAFHGLRSLLHPGIALTENPSFRKSRADEALQLVDMVCGAVGDSIDGDGEWCKMLKHRCLGITHLP